ncbi:unnamed protein product, partial [Heterotrigona itama]
YLTKQLSLVTPVLTKQFDGLQTSTFFLNTCNAALRKIVSSVSQCVLEDFDIRMYNSSIILIFLLYSPTSVAEYSDTN